MLLVPRARPGFAMRSVPTTSAPGVTRHPGAPPFCRVPAPDDCVTMANTAPPTSAADVPCPEDVMTRDAPSAPSSPTVRSHGSATTPGRARQSATPRTDGIQSRCSGTCHGRRAICEAFRSALQDLSWHGDLRIEDLLIDEDRVAQIFAVDRDARRRVHGHRRHEPPVRRIHGVRLCTMRDGLIHTERRLYDFTAPPHPGRRDSEQTRKLIAAAYPRALWDLARRIRA